MSEKEVAQWDAFVQEDEPQLCSVCVGDGEVEDYSHLSPPIDGDWPMITCPKCRGTGLEPQPAEKGDSHD